MSTMRSRTAGGSLTARDLGVIPVAGARGPETDKGEALRGLAELPWRPFAFREGQGFSWEAMAASMTLDQCWSISETWYEGRLDVDYERPPADHFQALLRGAGLVGDTWSLSPVPPP